VAVYGEEALTIAAARMPREQRSTTPAVRLRRRHQTDKLPLPPALVTPDGLARMIDNTGYRRFISRKLRCGFNCFATRREGRQGTLNQPPVRKGARSSGDTP